MITDDERVIIDLIGRRFIARGDQYAEQLANGAYNPVRKPLTRTALKDHLDGIRSYGHYMVSPEDDCVKLVAFDLDARKEPARVGDDEHLCDDPRAVLGDPAHPDYPEVIFQLRVLSRLIMRQLIVAAEEMELEVTPAMAFSGSKGIHVYGWLDRGRTKADIAIDLGGLTLDSFEDLGISFHAVGRSATFRNECTFPAIDVEIYPKQRTVQDKQYGNLMRLPLGRNLKTNGQSTFLKDLKFDGDEYRFLPMDPLQALERGCIG